jgi:hypothetical protein
MEMQKLMLIKEIEEAFEGVTLEEGIGINEADRMETGERDVLVNKGRNLDRLWWESWKDIEDKYPAAYSSVMYNMDSQGIKWVLPAYMIYIINHYTEGSFSIDSTIYVLEEGAMGFDRQDLFTPEQKQAIAHFLGFMIEVGEEYVDVESAKNALEKKWGQYSAH